MYRGDDGIGWVGSTIAERFAVDSVAGEGGFGIVYRGRHLGFDEPVAIKCLKLPAELTEDERNGFIVDFREEARLLHRLSRQSAAIVQALDIGAATSPRGVWTPFIVMEWLEGHSLAKHLQLRRDRGEPRHSVREAMRLLAPAAEALSVAHECSVAHLDVKPANLFVMEREPFLKVLDFGIAKVLSDSDTLNRALTRSEAAMRICTPQYAAPEQFNRQHGATGPWTDVFGLALVLVEVLTGRPALDGMTALQLYMSSVAQRTRPPLSESGVKASEQLEEAIRRALESNPTRRFRDVGGMWRALYEAAAIADASGKRSDPPLVVRPRLSAQPDALAGAATMAAPTTLQNRVCTVLFAEVLGPTDDGDGADPERQSMLLDRAFETLARCVAAVGGSSERPVGDTVMAFFGIEGDTLTAAERGIHAALRMRDVLAALESGRTRPLMLRVGINTGRVYLGRAASGTTVRWAARLQQAAQPGEILIGRDTHREAVGVFELEGVALTAQSGDTGMRKAYRVLGLASDHARRLARTRDFLGIETRFVGRGAELETIGGTIDTVRRDLTSRMLTIFGPAGVGRTRLLDELGAQLHDLDMVVLEAQCSPLYTQTSYALLASLLRARFHIHDDDLVDAIEQKLLRGIAALRSSQEATTVKHIAHMVEDSELVAQLVTIFGVRSEQPVDAIAADERSTQVKQRVAGALAALFRAPDKPIALLCDDVQWADEASLGLFEELLRRLPDAPLLIVCAAELSFFDRFPMWAGDDAGHGRLELMPLARRHLEAMARDRLRKVEGGADALVHELAERAEGSPLALVEMLHVLVDAGVIETGKDVWHYHANRSGELKLPTTVLGLVQARLDRLSPEALAVLCQAAVVGTTFWDGALQALGPTLDLDRLARVLADLRARRLIHARASSLFPEDQEYNFAERATQQVAYEMLGSAARRDLHRRIASWLERRLAKDSSASLVAHHYEQAGVMGRALEAYVRAGMHAASLGQPAEALHSFEHAWRLDAWLSGDIAPPSTAFWDEGDAQRPNWRERVKLAIGFGDVLRQLGRLDDALQRYEQARARVAKEDPDPSEPKRWSARVAYRMARAQIEKGLVEDPRATIERGIDDAASAGLIEERAELWALLAALDRRRRNFDAARAAARAGLRVCRLTRERSPAWQQAVSKLFVILGGVAHSTGKMVRAERFYRWACRVIDDNDNPDQLSRAVNNLAGARFARDDLKGARESFMRALALTDKSGNLLVRMISLANLGEVELRLGNAGVARGYLREAARLGAQIGAEGDLTDCHRNLAAACLALGDQDAALSEIGRALELVQVGGARRLYLANVLDTAKTILDALDDGAQRDIQRSALEAIAASLAKLESEDLSPRIAEVAAAVTRRLHASPTA